MRDIIEDIVIQALEQGARLPSALTLTLDPETVAALPEFIRVGEHRVAFASESVLNSAVLWVH